MAKIKIPSDKYKNAYTSILLEIKRIRQRYPNFHCKIVWNKKLVCKGEIKSPETNELYKFLIEYNYFGVPKSYIISPILQYDPKIHLYKDKSLCLYDWREDPWDNSKHISNTIIPWIGEWIVYFEIYKLTGKWIGFEAEHDNGKQSEN